MTDFASRRLIFRRYPQILNEQILKSYITQKGTKVDGPASTPQARANVNMMQVTGAVAHRREGIK